MEGDFRIGDWLVQPLRDVIDSEDGSVQLEPKAMDLLVYLAEHQGRVIPKERLIQAVWPDAFVTDEVLTNNIWKLRQAFGDDSKNPRIIQTVPRRGYQLIAEVVFEEATEESSRYEIQKKLGKGAMGEVHLAKDLQLDRQVALKFLPSQMEEDTSLRRRLFREARAAAALDQPFICKVYDTGQMGGRSFIAMEYVEGPTLKERLKEGPLALDEALRIAGEIAEALQAAHEKNIVHRDIKPSNIMLTEQGHVKVMDFGVAKRLSTAEGDQDWTATLTTDASSMGTLPYMSPEQIRGQAVDARSDIFSLGVVLYEMFTGVHPFRRPLSADTAAAILSEPPPAVSRFRKGLPIGLQALLNRTLAKDREDRYQSIQGLLVDLPHLDSQDASHHPIVILRRNGKRLAVAVVALVAVASISVMVFWSLWTGPSPRQPLSPVPLTSSPGMESTPALSPDGTYVAFSWDGEAQDNFDIYVQLIGTPEPHRLTTDPAGDRFPTWSPDGSQIAFLRRVSKTKHSVFVKPVLGGSERKLAEITRAGLAGVGNYYGGLSWSPDDPLLAMVDRASPEEPDSIFLLSLKTGEKRRLSFPPKAAMDDSPSFSPDGTKVAFHRSGPKQEHVIIQSLHGVKATYLASSPLFVRGLDWTSDGSGIVFSLSEMSSQESYLSYVPLTEGAPERLLFGEGARAVSIARSGGRLVYEHSRQSNDIWRVSGPKSPETRPPTRFAAASTRNESLPDYSPDGSKVIFVSDRSGDAEIWRCDADGTHLQQLTTLGFSLLGEWSPEGDRIAFAASEAGDEIFDIFVLDEDGGLPRNVTQDEFSDACPSWSSDGDSLYYHSLRDDGGQIFKVPVGGGPTVQLTKEEGWVPRVAEDGQVLFFRDGSIWSLPGDGGEETLVLDKELEWIFDWCTWKGNIVYYGWGEEGGTTIEMFNMTSKEPRMLHSLGEEAEVGHGLSVSPDGQWILYTQEEFSADLMLVENFY